MTDREIVEFIDFMHNKLNPFPFPNNWLDICALCKLRAISAIAQEHGRVAELYNNARKSEPFAFRVYMFGTRLDDRDRSWLGIRLRATKTENSQFVCALDNVPLVCECRTGVELTGNEKDAILRRATRETVDPFRYRGG